MASIPVVRDGNKTLTPTPDEVEAARKAGLLKAAEPTLSFEDGPMPTAMERAAATNPFQDKVNEIDKNVRNGVKPDASSVVVKDEDVEWARTKIRAAIAAIKRGAVTNVVPEKAKPGYTRVWFSTKAPTSRARK